MNEKTLINCTRFCTVGRFTSPGKNQSVQKSRKHSSKSVSRQHIRLTLRIYRLWRRSVRCVIRFCVGCGPRRYPSLPGRPSRRHWRSRSWGTRRRPCNYDPTRTRAGAMETWIRLIGVPGIPLPVHFTVGSPWRGISNFGAIALTTAPHFGQSTSRIITVSPHSEPSQEFISHLLQAPLPHREPGT